MNVLFQTPSLYFVSAGPSDIETIMGLENAPENRAFVWQGTKEEHLSEMKDPHTLLLLIKTKAHDQLAGYCLCTINSASAVFELRRIVMEIKEKGYGKEAIAGLLDYAFFQLHINRFWLDVYPHNKRAIHVYESLGFIHEGTLRQSYRAKEGYMDQMIFSILKEDYVK